MLGEESFQLVINSFDNKFDRENIIHRLKLDTALFSSDCETVSIIKEGEDTAAADHEPPKTESFPGSQSKTVCVSSSFQPLEGINSPGKSRRQKSSMNSEDGSNAAQSLCVEDGGTFSNE